MSLTRRQVLQAAGATGVAALEAGGPRKRWAPRLLFN